MGQSSPSPLEVALCDPIYHFLTPRTIITSVLLAMNGVYSNKSSQSEARYGLVGKDITLRIAKHTIKAKLQDKIAISVQIGRAGFTVNEDFYKYDPNKTLLDNRNVVIYKIKAKIMALQSGA